MDWQQKTIETYNQSAEPLAAYFAGIGSRVADIERGVTLTGQDPKTIHCIEIGCGSGRDAADILPRVGQYEGFDPSTGLLNIARKNVPDASFVSADALSYDYPANTDLYFAFASLLHVNRAGLRQVFSSVRQSLRPGGIAYLSLKERATYKAERRDDEHGSRMFYYYNSRIVEEIAGPGFTKVFEDHQPIGTTRWFTTALKK